jgi:hypothetical protein
MNITLAIKDNSKILALLSNEIVDFNHHIEPGVDGANFTGQVPISTNVMRRNLLEHKSQT